MAQSTGLEELTTDHKTTLAGLLAAWRAKIEHTGQQLAAELEAQVAERLEGELAAAAADARRTTRRRLTDDLNQAVRRLRQARSSEEVTDWLLEASAPFAKRAALIGVDGGHLEGLRLRGVEAEPARQLFESLDLLLEAAAAFQHCVREKEPVVSLASPPEISVYLMDIFRHQPEDRAHLLPVVVHGEVAAILYAPGSESTDAPALELLTAIAATMTEALVPVALPEVAPPSGLVHIQVAPPAPVARAVALPDWSSLPKDQQELHLLARRFARVHVAEIRLYHSARVENGRRARRLYLELKKEIDDARETFRQKFMLASPSMVDYFHLELVRSLAHDEVAALGRDYPGPLE